MAREKTPFTPEEVGYYPERIDEIDAHFERLIKKNIIQSANYCLSRDGKVFANNSVGKQSFKAEDKRPLQTNNIRGIASITKIFTATAIFKLMEDGYIRANQPVAEILYEFNTPTFNTITIGQLLSHTSGIYPDTPCFPNKYKKSPWFYIQARDDKTSWLEAGLSVGVFNKPGKEWAYCSFGFCILGEIIARVSGMKAEKFIIDNILEPCNMIDSGFFHYFKSKEAEEKFFSLADRFNIQNEEDMEMINQLKMKKSLKDNGKFNDVPGTGGDMYSTTEDLNKFGFMLLNNGVTHEGKRVIGRKAIERMTENYTLPEIHDNCWGAQNVYRMYALGPDTRRSGDNFYSPGTFFHEGAGACCLLIDPKEKMVASWFVPFATEQWYADPLYNAINVMWSGIK